MKSWQFGSDTMLSDIQQRSHSWCKALWVDIWSAGSQWDRYYHTCSGLQCIEVWKMIQHANRTKLQAQCNTHGKHLLCSSRNSVVPWAKANEQSNISFSHLKMKGEKLSDWNPITPSEKVTMKRFPLTKTPPVSLKWIKQEQARRQHPGWMLCTCHVQHHYI